MLFSEQRLLENRATFTDMIIQIKKSFSLGMCLGVVGLVWYHIFTANLLSHTKLTLA